MLEVAQFTFTPSAGAVLADWGADVIKVEHAEYGDAQRGLTIGAGGAAAGSFQPLMEHPNRGKRSIGLALEVPSAREVLCDWSGSRTSSSPTSSRARQAARYRCRGHPSDQPEHHLRARQRARPTRPEADRPGYDGSTFWSRMGCAWGVTPPDSRRLLGQPSGAFGDSIGGAMMAGGVAAALFAGSGPARGRSSTCRS